MRQTAFTSKQWRRVEYERLVDRGVFEDQPLELIGGQLIVAEPKVPPHAVAVGMAGEALWAALSCVAIMPIIAMRIPCGRR